MRLPPFGKPLKALLQQGQLPSHRLIFLYTGKKAWETVKKRTQTDSLVLPLHQSPENYHWPVSGCTVAIIHTSPIKKQLLEDIAYVLLKCNADFVVTKNPDKNEPNHPVLYFN